MLIKKPADIPYSEVTPKDLYLNRRTFIAAAGVAGAALAAGQLLPDVLHPALVAQAGSKLQFKKSDLSTHGEALTPLNRTVSPVRVGSPNSTTAILPRRSSPAKSSHP